MKRLWTAGLIALIGALSAYGDGPTADDAMAAAKKAAAYMMETVAYRGGFVEKYREDLSERWGEVPARESMVWVQEPGTVSMGVCFLRAHQATGEPDFLAYAKRCADALVWGQLPSGGWHYFIDFEPAGTQDWYHDVLAKAWGWEEFYHWNGNATFDDNTTVGAAEFLLDLYTETQDPAYKGPVLKALQCLLDAQYPLGGWPQRYPVSEGHQFEGRPDYSAYYTFNDGVTSGNIFLLLKAYEQLGDPAYNEAALRGMYFTMIVQVGNPNGGWAQQYNMALEPAQARSFEPGGLAPSQTQQCINDLMRFYKATGDSRYLRGIPDAIDWLDRARLPKGHSEDRTHAQFVEVGTNRPLYAHREGTDIDNGRYWVDSEPGNFPGHYGMQITVDVDAIRKELRRVQKLSPEDARAEFEAEQYGKPALPDVSAETAAEIIGGMNESGAWVEDLEAVDYTDWKYKPKTQFRGIATRTFQTNFTALVAYAGRGK